MMTNLKLFLITFILCTSLANVTFAQKETSTYKTVVNQFEKDYNAQRFEKIFASFSFEMQTALPLEKANEFLTGLHRQSGEIVERRFIEYVKTYASYKTKFERGVFSLNISIDADSKINGFYVQPFKESDLPKLTRNKTKLILPFKEEWTVIWGGDTEKQNYHVESNAQKNAFDLVIEDKRGLSYKTDGKTNEDYYAFGKNLIAPCDGEIVLVVDGIKDNVPEILNPIYIPGNTIIIKTVNGEYLFFAHFKQHSIVVKQGQKVKQGELLGLCGNSGNSSEPHLHFHIQNVEDMNIATGVKCYFDGILVNGSVKTDYSPVQKEKISIKRN